MCIMEVQYNHGPCSDFGRGNGVWRCLRMQYGACQMIIEGLYTILLKHVMSHAVQMHTILPRTMRCLVFLVAYPDFALLLIKLTVPYSDDWGEFLAWMSFVDESDKVHLEQYTLGMITTNSAQWFLCDPQNTYLIPSVISKLYDA